MLAAEVKRRDERLKSGPITVDIEPPASPKQAVASPNESAHKQAPASPKTGKTKASRKSKKRKRKSEKLASASAALLASPRVAPAAPKPAKSPGPEGGPPTSPVGASGKAVGSPARGPARLSKEPAGGKLQASSWFCLIRTDNHLARVNHGGYACRPGGRRRRT